MPTISSNLEAWPGSMVLPEPQDFNGVMFNDWRDALDKIPDNMPINRMYCYAGLDFVKQHGKWAFELPLADVQAWQKDPANERVMLVSWLGKQFRDYFSELLDPKG